MRKLLVGILCVAIIISAVACSKNSNSSDSGKKVDVDLSAMSSTMAYVELGNILNEPDKYIGKTIKMDGLYQVYSNEDASMFYDACVLIDSAACCSLGMEFVAEGITDDFRNEHEIGDLTITVIGTLEAYLEDGYTYYHLINTQMEIKEA